jgi:hypothetical protein
VWVLTEVTNQTIVVVDIGQGCDCMHSCVPCQVESTGRGTWYAASPGCSTYIDERQCALLPPVHPSGAPVLSCQLSGHQI